MHVTLLSNLGYEWADDAVVYFKGFFFHGNNLYEGNSAVAYFSGTQDFGDFRDKLAGLNGSFAVVVHRTAELFAAVDRLRSIPLFYSANDDFTISDSADAILQVSPTARMDKAAAGEFGLVGYVVGNKTLVEGVRQLQAGEALSYSAGIRRTEYYYQHSHSEFIHGNESAKLDALDEITDRVFSRLLKSCKGRPIAVPLSGGYDSRYIAASLKRLGANNVFCFAYGKENSFEVSISRKVAEEIGFDWHFVEYLDEKWRGCIDDTAFVEFASNMASLPNVQDYVALKELKQRGVLQDNTVVVPGYCGDLLGGSYVPYELLIEKPDRLFREGLPAYIARTQFRVDRESDQSAAILARIEDEIQPGLRVDDIEGFVSRNEEFFTRHKVAKYVVNAVRSIEFFGFEWRMPLWDNELVEYFYRIPVADRKDSKLYDKYLHERVFAPFGIDYQKKPENRFKRAFKKRCPEFLYGGLEISYRNAMMHLRKKETVDINRFSGLVGLCLAEMGSGKALARRDIISIYAAWYLEMFLSKKVHSKH